MDTFTFMIAIILMMIAVQFDQSWLIFGVVALMILTMRSLSTTILLIVATAILLLAKDYLADYWPFVLFGLIILSLIISREQGQQQTGYPDMFGGEGMGGMGLGGGF